MIIFAGRTCGHPLNLSARAMQVTSGITVGKPSVGKFRQESQLKM
jgi:hypothetical protein